MTGLALRANEPLISGKVTRISRSRRNAWRAVVLVGNYAEVVAGDYPMATSHHDTKADAETWLEGMIKAYAEAYYFQV